MNEKLRILMQKENLTASRIAEILGIQPAAVSHILKGRNKPSFELICKIVNKFPQINPYWLLGDAEKMYNAEQVPTIRHESGTLFDASNANIDNMTKSAKSDISEFATNVTTSTLGRSNIEKIIIVYHDQTFEELRPKN